VQPISQENGQAAATSRYINAAYRRTAIAPRNRSRRLFPCLLPHHRAQSGASLHDAASARLSRVERSGACARRADALASAHGLYRRRDRTPADREKAYRALFRAALDPDFIADLRAATNGGWALDDGRFKQQFARALGRRVEPLPRGRPPKAKAERRQLSLLECTPAVRHDN
jgi:hypothetical protein